MMTRMHGKTPVLAHLCLFIGLVVLVTTACSPPSSTGAPKRSTPKSSPTTHSTRFQIHQHGITHWLTTPTGQPFFSFGVSGVDLGVLPEELSDENPAYSAARLYATPQAWAQTVTERLRNWRVNTVGGWSNWDRLHQEAGPQLATTPVLHLGITAGFPWEDMWNPEAIALLDRVAHETISPFLASPGVVGYFSDNELGWWNAALFNYTLQHPPRSGQRQRLVELLARRYQGQWQNLVQDFIPEGARSFVELSRHGKLTLRPGSNGIAAYREFLALLAARYYELMHRAIKAVDPGALILGDRYASYFYPEVAAAAAPWVDVISTNLKAHWNDGTFLRFYLSTLHETSNRPVYVSEIYCAAMENRSGNRNQVGDFPRVGTQMARARAVERQLRFLSSHPNVVGVNWFQYYDEPPFGRADGEDFNMGLVDIAGRPYTPLTGALEDLDLTALHAEFQHTPYRGQIPPAPPQPMADFSPLNALQDWNRAAGFVPATSPSPQADLYTCWAPDIVYFAAYAAHPAEPDYYQDQRVPSVDQMRFTLDLPNTQVRVIKTLGQSPKAFSNQQELAIPLLHFELHIATNALLVIGVPQRLIQSGPLAAGTPLEIKAELTGHARVPLASWQHTLRCADYEQLNR